MNQIPDQQVIQPYGCWDSPVSIEAIFSQPAAPMYPLRADQRLYWLQALPDEGGRVALMQLAESGSVKCLTPGDFNIRTSVHEYGGCCFCYANGFVIFNNFKDRRLYKQGLHAGDLPVAITANDSSCSGFADLIMIPGTNVLLAVIERTRSGVENSNAIVAINIETGLINDVVSGSDFYACPTVSSDRNTLAWFEWSHPDMPWDQTRVCEAELVETVSDAGQSFYASSAKKILSLPDHSANQTGYLADGSLLYACDSNDRPWSNLHRWKKRELIEVTSLQVEFGEAHWVFGQKRWVQTDDDTVYAIATSHQGDSLYRVSLGNFRPPEKVLEDAGIAQVCFSDKHLQMVVSPVDSVPYILEMDPVSAEIIGKFETADLRKPDISVPQPFQCSTRDGEQTCGYFYRPCNAACIGPDDQKPPLVVMVHGGPTSRTNRTYQPLKQYFSSIGFAVLDINHRGSTGYGRSYRQRLKGGWGEVDAMDIVDAVQYLIDQGEANPDAIFIRGGSAGGYAVLRALTVYPEVFAGGACYYGIGNLITLSEITHKFESRYTDMLIGEPFNAEKARHETSRYMTRSPIFHMDKLTAPIILFQGLLDKVVPPEVSREVVTLLKKRGVSHRYHEYANEGHGFRNTENRVDSLRQEIAFFQSALGESESQTT